MSGTTIRVIFVGDTNVGKTALNTRYLQNDFNPEGAPTISPASSSATAKTLSGKEVTLQLWDTAGQERFHSFSTVKTWGSRVHEFEPNCKFVIAVTKIDLVEDRAAIVQLANRVMKEEDISDVFYTSSKTGESVQELFARVATLGDKKSDKVETESKSSQNTQSTTEVKSVSLTETSHKKKKGCCK